VECSFYEHDLKNTQYQITQIRMKTEIHALRMLSHNTTAFPPGLSCQLAEYFKLSVADKTCKSFFCVFLEGRKIAPCSGQWLGRRVSCELARAAFAISINFPTPRETLGERV